MSNYPPQISSERARIAMEAHTNITVLGAVIALCDGSLMYGRRMSALEAKVIRLCKKEAQAQLRIMDKATGRKS